MSKWTNLLAERISEGLKRKSITSCSKWAEEYRVMGKPFPGKWSFLHHPWLREMHDCRAEEIVGQKSAQMGYTECALNRAFYAIDVLRESVLYILPASKPDASDFSSARFDPALELSPHLRDLFSSNNNVGLKRAGSACLYIRGSHSRGQMKSIPLARLIADEVDEMDEGNLILAFERTSGQEEKDRFLLSTPSISGIGINRYFEQTSKKHFFFKCPCCGKSTELTYPECLVITAESPVDPRVKDSHIICKECKGTLNQASKIIFLADGIWIPQEHNRNSEGYQINQLYSTVMQPWELAIQALKARTNPTDEQEFYNSKLGLTHEVDGARIKDEDLEACKRDYTSKDKSSGNFICTMGIDVGKWLHYEIDEWMFDHSVPTRDINIMAKARCIKAGKVQSFTELDLLMRQYNVSYSVIDQQPESRLALDFCKRWHGRARMCQYDANQNGSQLTENEREYKVKANRTSWLDLALSRFRTRNITLPQDISFEYQEHLKTLTRIYEKDKSGNPTGRYIKAEHDPDHFAHARNYSEIALLLGCGLLRSENVNNLW